MSGLLSIAWIQGALLLGATAQGIPPSMPPLPEDPVLWSAAPPQCVAFFAWMGCAAPDPASPNRSEKLLAEPAVQKLIAAVGKAIRSGVHSAAEKSQPGSGAAAVEDYELAMFLLAHPAAAFFSRAEFSANGAPPDAAGGCVVNLGDQAEKIAAQLASRAATDQASHWTTVTLDGGTWHRSQPNPAGPELTWGMHGKYLIAGLGAGEVEKILARLNQAPPAWLTAVRARLPVQRLSMFAFLNTKSLIAQLSEKGGPKAAIAVRALGLDAIQALAFVSGLDEGGYVERILVGAPGKPAGVLGLLPENPLTPKDLAPIPQDAMVAGAARFDLDQIWQKSLDMAAQIDADAARQFRTNLAQAETRLGGTLHDDLLGPLGDSWCYAIAPPRGGKPLPGILLVAQVRDAARLRNSIDKLVNLANATLAAQAGGSDKPVPSIERQTRGSETLFVLDPKQPSFPMKPTWCVTGKELLVANAPDVLEAYLNGAGRSGSLADVPAIRDRLRGPNPPFALVCQDSGAMLRQGYPGLMALAYLGSGQLKQAGIDFDPMVLPPVEAVAPHFDRSITTLEWDRVGLRVSKSQTLPLEDLTQPTNGPLLAGLLVPAVVRARATARRAASSNNLRQIGVALLAYESQNRALPPPCTLVNGKPGLSWRVLVLPQLGEEELYKQFHLDEPWDSEHNRPLLKRMPRIYRSPTSSGPADHTSYLGIGGTQGVFGGTKGLSLDQIADGLSNTIFVAEVDGAEEVPWTRPTDFTPDKTQPTKGLAKVNAPVIVVLMGDGAVRSLAVTIDPKTLNALFTYNGGEAVGEF